MHNLKEQVTIKSMVLKKRDTAKLDFMLEERSRSILKKYSYAERIEVCYQEIERSRENPNPIMTERTIYHYYKKMIENISKLEIITDEHRFLMKYIYLRGLISRIHNGLSSFEAQVTLKQSLNDHVKEKFQELNQLWRELSPLLQLLYQENVENILKECVSYNQSSPKSYRL